MSLQAFLRIMPLSDCLSAILPYHLHQKRQLPWLHSFALTFFCSRRRSYWKKLQHLQLFLCILICDYRDSSSLKALLYSCYRLASPIVRHAKLGLKKQRVKNCQVKSKRKCPKTFGVPNRSVSQNVSGTEWPISTEWKSAMHACDFLKSAMHACDFLKSATS